MQTTAVGPERFDGGYRHEALLYSGLPDFVEHTARFIRDGLEGDEPVLVVVGAAKIDALRDELGSDGGAVLFADMVDVGTNPARIIPAWRSFIDEHSSGSSRVRGIGEPIWAERSPAELVESQRHEALLNLAFDATTPLWLLCPYDTEGLSADVIAEAHASHALISDGHETHPSDSYRRAEAVAAPFDPPLSPPSVAPFELTFRGDLRDVRREAERRAKEAGLDDDRVADFVLAVDEVASNSVVYADGGGTLSIWTEAGSLVGEISDRGRIQYPLAGRTAPAVDDEGGRGLWIVNQVCDLVQVRCFAEGSTVRVHMRIP